MLLYFIPLIIFLDIAESLCYPLPEHPNRQHVFSLTTYTGDTYCFQVCLMKFFILFCYHLQEKVFIFL